MEQTVYIDLYFIINFSMDFLCFFLCARLLSVKESLLRILAASAFGALYACISLLLGLSGIVSLLADISACAVMSAIAFLKRGEARHLPANAIVYTAVSIVLGGFMTALFSLFNRIGLDRMLGSEQDSDGISVWMFALLALIGGLASAFGGGFFKKKRARRECRIWLTNRRKTVEMRGIIDSGNLLRDPISARLCIIADLDKIKSLLSRGSVRALGNADKKKGVLFEGEDAARVRIVPLKTVSGEGIAYAFRFDRVEIDSGSGRREVDALVVASSEPINAGDASALVPAELDI